MTVHIFFLWRHGMKKPLLLICFLAIFAAASFAQIFDFTLVNKTGYTIDEVYCAPSQSDDWEEDVLGVDTLPNGSKVEITFPPLYEKALLILGIDLYDLRCVYDDGEVAEWFGLKLEEIMQITLTYSKDGTTYAEWK